MSDKESFRQEFYIEAREILEKANADTLKAELKPNEARLLNAVFRGIHTIKGGAGMFEMNDIASFCHELEGILNMLRDGVVPLNSVLVDYILAGIDHINKMVDDYSDGKDATISKELIDQYRAIVKDPLSLVGFEEQDEEINAVFQKEPGDIIEASPDRDKSTKEIQTMRIDESKVEQFTNVVGELLIARNSYDYLLSRIQNNEMSLIDSLKLLKDNLYHISSLTNEIHHGVMSLRMVPIRNIFSRFNRIVRDISRRQRKPIVMITKGDDIEIDKKIADVLFDPLVHLVRNACDHGIESPEERILNGKPEQGHVTLKASQEGSSLNIRVIDDGMGMNRKQLFEKGKKAGLDISSPDDDAVLDVIFLPGVSTKAQVSDISGRGVGMDVVKNSIETLGGTIHVSTKDQKGSEIMLAIPMRMGINDTLIIEYCNDSYAIPIDYIIETMKIRPEDLKNACGEVIFYYRGEVLPVKSLHHILGKKGQPKNATQEISMIIIQNRTQKFGLIVDRLVRNMEVAIKTLPDSIDQIDVVSGVSIMGDGKVVLVLNPDQF